MTTSPVTGAIRPLPRPENLGAKPTATATPASPTAPETPAPEASETTASDATASETTDPVPALPQYLSYEQTHPDLRFPAPTEPAAEETATESTAPPETPIDYPLGQTEADTHVYQYGEASQSDELSPKEEKREEQANCGPASAAIVLKRLGIPYEDLHNLRIDGDAVVGSDRPANGVYAIDADQLRTMVELNAARQMRDVESERIVLPEDAEAAYDTIRTALADGHEVVLRTGNMDSNGNGGHYVVVNSVGEPPDRQLNISDPQNPDGAEHIESFEEFEQALKKRDKIGMPSDILLFKEKPQKIDDPFLEARMSPPPETPAP